MTYLIGSDGSATLPSGYAASLNTFSATLTRTTQVVTGFGDTFQQRRASGVLDLTGSAGGTLEDDAASTSPLGIHGSAAGGNVTLVFGQSASTLVFPAVFSSTAFSVAQDGASTVTFNFELSGAITTATWDEGA